jgi:hypothetical protein
LGPRFGDCAACLECALSLPAFGPSSSALLVCWPSRCFHASPLTRHLGLRLAGSCRILVPFIAQSVPLIRWVHGCWCWAQRDRGSSSLRALAVKFSRFRVKRWVHVLGLVVTAPRGTLAWWVTGLSITRRLVSWGPSLQHFGIQRYPGVIGLPHIPAFLPERVVLGFMARCWFWSQRGHLDSGAPLFRAVCVPSLLGVLGLLAVLGLAVFGTVLASAGWPSWDMREGWRSWGPHCFKGSPSSSRDGDAGTLAFGAVCFGCKRWSYSRYLGR